VLHVRPQPHSYRNRFTLGFFWSLQLTNKLVGWVGQRSKPGAKSLARSLFPHGVLPFAVGCARTSCLLFSFTFFFWSFMGLKSTCTHFRFASFNPRIHLSASHILLFGRARITTTALCNALFDEWFRVCLRH
jgi:hypothetical protein